MGVRLRYAPSPTGHLHIGGARTALFNYLYARNQGGVFILRIEDTDLERNIDQAAEKFAASLRWLGIEWDEGAFIGGPYGPYFCTERLAIYDQYVDRLRQEGYAYDCFCTEEDLQRERDEAAAAGTMLRYSGRCRHLSPVERARYEAEGRQSTVRFRVPDEHAVHFDDLIRGALVFESHGIGGDFIIVKSNGIPTYNFACTVDDHLMEITHVVRGEEHISNTPRQLLLYEAFGWEPPVFGHVSLILGKDGRKLSKRDESIIQFMDQYRDLGYLPEAVFNFLSLLGWSPAGEQEIFTREDLIAAFSFDRVARSGAYFDPVRLTWMNGHYLKQREASSLLPLVRPFVERYREVAPWTLDDAWLTEWIALYKDQVGHLSELTDVGKAFLEDVEPDEEATGILAGGNIGWLPELASRLESLKAWAPESLKGAVKEAGAASGVKGKALFIPIRAAIMGRVHGPDLHQSLALLGKDRVLSRLRRALELYGSLR